MKLFKESKLRRLFTAVTAGALLLSLAGCGGPAAQSDPPPPAPTAAARAAKTASPWSRR